MGYIYISFIEINDVVNVGIQEEAAEAYDIAAMKFRGLNEVTNFDMSRYDVKSILESSTLPIGGPAKRLKDVEEDDEDSRHRGKNRRLK
jgi:AP2-like factor (ANT lineage)